MQIPITRWPKPVVQRSLKISYFLHFLLCRRCGPLPRPFASVFGNSFLQFLFPLPFCNLNLQFLLQLLSAIPLQLPFCDRTRIQGKRTIRGNHTRTAIQGDNPRGQYKGQYKVPSQGENRRTQTKGTVRGPKPRGQ